MEGLIETLCPAEAVQTLVEALFPLQAMRTFRDRSMLASTAGRRYEELFRAHSLELVRLVVADKRALDAARQLMELAGRIVADEGEGRAPKIGKGDLAVVGQALAVFRKLGSRSLRSAIAGTEGDLRKVKLGKSLHEAFLDLDKRPPSPRKLAAKRSSNRRK
jgi:hypothetical protein